MSGRAGYPRLSVFPSQLKRATPACAASSEVSIAGLSDNCRRHLCVFLVPVWDDAGTQARDGQFCSDLKQPRDYKSGSRSAATSRVTRAKEKYETQHERQAQGQLPRSKGNHQGGSRKGYKRPEIESHGESRKEGGRASAADRPCERHCRKILREG